MLSPILGQVSARLGCAERAHHRQRVTDARPLSGAVRIAKVDTEKYPVLATKYHVTALPTLVLFKGGAPVDRFEGLPTAEQLELRVRSHL
jgi:hypothetical protein